jgi:hypothetical protein
MFDDIQCLQPVEHFGGLNTIILNIKAYQLYKQKVILK